MNFCFRGRSSQTTRPQQEASRRRRAPRRRRSLRGCRRRWSEDPRKQGSPGSLSWPFCAPSASCLAMKMKCMKIQKEMMKHNMLVRTEFCKVISRAVAFCSSLFAYRGMGSGFSPARARPGWCGGSARPSAATGWLGCRLKFTCLHLRLLWAKSGRRRSSRDGRAGPLHKSYVN